MAVHLGFLDGHQPPLDVKLAQIEIECPLTIISSVGHTGTSDNDKRCLSQREASFLPECLVAMLLQFMFIMIPISSHGRETETHPGGAKRVFTINDHRRMSPQVAFPVLGVFLARFWDMMFVVQVCGKAVRREGREWWRLKTRNFICRVVLIEGFCSCI